MKSSNKPLIALHHIMLNACWCICVFVICMTHSLAYEQANEFADAEAAKPIVAIISHLDNSNLTLPDIKRFYSLRKRLLNNGDSVLLSMLPPDSPESVAVFRYLVGMYPYQLQRTWDRAVFSGKGSAPISLPDSSKIKAFVKANSAAIGYISVANIEELERLKENVNVVAIVP